jgi:hypothetical protein
MTIDSIAGAGQNTMCQLVSHQTKDHQVCTLSGTSAALANKFVRHLNDDMTHLSVHDRLKSYTDMCQSTLQQNVTIFVSSSDADDIDDFEWFLRLAQQFDVASDM